MDTYDTLPSICFYLWVFCRRITHSTYRINILGIYIEFIHNHWVHATTGGGFLNALYIRKSFGLILLIQSSLISFIWKKLTSGVQNILILVSMMTIIGNNSSMFIIQIVWSPISIDSIFFKGMLPIICCVVFQVKYFLVIFKVLPCHLF